MNFMQDAKPERRGCEQVEKDDKWRWRAPVPVTHLSNSEP